MGIEPFRGWTDCSWWNEKSGVEPDLGSGELGLNELPRQAAFGGTYNPLMPLPMVPLSYAAGVVVDVGNEVRRARVGDRIITHYASRWVDGEPAEDRSLHTLGNTLAAVRLLSYFALAKDLGEN